MNLQLAEFVGFAPTESSPWKMTSNFSERLAWFSNPIKTSEPIRFGEDLELDLRVYELRRSGVPLA